jgi:hypothetical protein
LNETLLSRVAPSGVARHLALANDLYEERPMRQPNENDQCDILTDMNPDALIHAIEENAAAFLLALGRAGGGEERADSEVTWTIGGSPLSYHNAVVRANLTPQTADAAILARLLWVFSCAVYWSRGSTG